MRRCAGEIGLLIRVSTDLESNGLQTSTGWNQGCLAKTLCDRDSAEIARTAGRIAGSCVRSRPVLGYGSAFVTLVADCKCGPVLSVVDSASGGEMQGWLYQHLSDEGMESEMDRWMDGRMRDGDQKARASGPIYGGSGTSSRAGSQKSNRIARLMTRLPRECMSQMRATQHKELVKRSFACRSGLQRRIENQSRAS